MRYYTEQDKRFITDNINLTDREIAVKLNRTPVSIKCYRKKMGLVKFNGRSRNNPLTIEEKQYILNHPELTNLELSKRLKRSEATIWKFINS